MKRIILITLFTLVFLTSCNINSDRQLVNTKQPIQFNSDLNNFCISLGPNETSINVNWLSKTNKEYFLQIATSASVEENGFDNSDYYQYKADTESSYSRDSYYTNKLTIENLFPNTTYSIRYGCSNNWSPITSYTTTGFDSKDYEFLVFGDAQLGVNNLETDKKSWLDTVSTAVTSYPNSAFLMSLGDQVNEYTDLNIINTQYNAFMEYQSITSLPIITLTGNHESGNPFIFEHFNNPNSHSYLVNGSNTPCMSHYYFTYNNTLFIVLNSNYLYDTKHLDTLLNDINNEIKDNNSIKWKVLAFHNSIYSTAGHVGSDYTNQLKDYLSDFAYDNSFDLVLMGHDHVYVRTYPIGKGQKVIKDSLTNAPVYVTLNSSSGSKYYDIIEDDYPFSAVVSQNYSPNYTHISVSNNDIEVSTYDISNSKSIDSFVISK